MADTTVDYKMIGNRIKNRRRELNLTQDKLANSLNITTFYLSKIENGHANPTLDILSLIAYEIDIDLALLITGTSTLEKKYYIEKLNEICSKANNKQLDLIIRLSKAVLDE